MTTSIEDLLAKVESEASTKSFAERGRRLVDLMPPTAYRAAVVALGTLVFQLRGRVEMLQADVLIDQADESGLKLFRRSHAESKAANARMAKAREARASRKISNGALVHASPRIHAARLAWSEWINTEVPIPGTNTRLQIGDMTADQLQQIAHVLYDTHLQLHALAEALVENDVHTARQLPQEAQALVLEAAS